MNRNYIPCCREELNTVFAGRKGVLLPQSFEFIPEISENPYFHAGFILHLVTSKSLSRNF